MSDAAGKRREDARRMAELAASTRRNEALAAQVLVDQFVVDAKARGIPTVPLLATQLDGRRVKTDKTGWYVNKKESLAIGEAGEWYVLTVAAGWKARFAGVRLVASPPELVVARGGRDGESGDLVDFLDRVLNGE